MDIENKLTEIYSKYDENIRIAHMKIIQIEKMYKNKSYKENEEVLDSIDKVIKEAAKANDN